MSAEPRQGINNIKADLLKRLLLLLLVILLKIFLLII
jgi:hypothetical protein